MKWMFDHFGVYEFPSLFLKLGKHGKCDCLFSACNSWRYSCSSCFVIVFCKPILVEQIVIRSYEEPNDKMK